MVRQLAASYSVFLKVTRNKLIVGLTIAAPLGPFQDTFVTIVPKNYMIPANSLTIHPHGCKPTITSSSAFHHNNFSFEVKTKKQSILIMPPNSSPPDAPTELSKKYETPLGIAHTTMQALKDRIRLHYDLASDYYLNLW